MVFNPRTDFFLPDGLVMHSSNRVDEGGVFEIVANLLTADRDFIKCVDKDGRAKNIYRLAAAVEATPKADRIRAYWCPYENNRTRYTTLTLLGDYMFTAVMDGCTFGVGHAAGDGSVTVSHANAQASDTRDSHEPMIAAQRTSTLGRLGPRAKLFEPKDYRTRGYIWNRKSDVSAATFGVKEDTKWVFYAHRFRKEYQGNHSVYKYYDTSKIK